MNTVSLSAMFVRVRSHVSFVVNPKNGRAASMISQEIYEIVRDNAEALDSAIIYNRDFSYNL